MLAGERTHDEVAFVTSVLGLAAGSTILDIACGQGRILLPLARSGYLKIGVDLRPVQLAQTRAVTAATVFQVGLLQAGMRRFRLSTKVDAVISMFSAIGYFETDVEYQATFQNVFAALRAGGVFLLDTANPLGVFRRYAGKDWQETPDGL